MKERPILFNTEMVRAVLDGRKTMTRRVINPQPGHFHYFEGGQEPCDIKGNSFKCPYGKPSGRLWVRETWNFWENPKNGEDWVNYKAGGKMRFPNIDNLPYPGNPFDGKWKPGMNTPFDPIATKNADGLKVVITNKDISNLKKIIFGKEFQGTTIS